MSKRSLKLIGTPRSILILRALQLGDLLCAVPAFRALRSAFPEARIVLLGLPWARAFVDRFSSCLDGFIALPGYPGLPEQSPQPEKISSFLAGVQSKRFDLAIQMHGNGSITNSLTLLLGAKQAAGYYQPGEFCPDPLRFLPYPTTEHEVWRHLRLMEFLEVPLRGDGLHFPVDEEDHLALRAVDEAAELEPGRYVCVHPGARCPTRRWPPQGFARVADALAERGLQIVLTGSSDEADPPRAVANHMKACAVDMAGKTDLGSLAALLSESRLLVSNDTGLSHLAAALSVPSVVIFLASDPKRWAPLDRRRHRILYRPGEDLTREQGLPASLEVSAEALIAQAGEIV